MSNQEKQIENMVDKVTKNKNNKFINFLVNASNQCNLTNTYKLTSSQTNAVFILINPYFIENLGLENCDLDIKINENHMVIIDNQEFEPVEIRPGIKVWGIINDKRSEE